MPAPDDVNDLRASDSLQIGSALHPPAGGAQLSVSLGVTTEVSSVAIESGLLTLAGVPQADEAPSDSHESASDADIMLRVKTGDESAFAYLVQKYRRQMVGFMYRMCRNPATAEELAQEVFLRVYR